MGFFSFFFFFFMVYNTVFKTTCSSWKPLPPALHLNLRHTGVCGNCVRTFSWKERRGCVDQIGAREVMIQKTASRNDPLIDLLGDNLIPQQYLLIILQVNYVQNGFLYLQMNTKPDTYL